jgi:hypothetical protein
MSERLRALRYRVRLYRCLVCQRPRLLHTPRGAARCDTTPLPIVLTPAGRARALEGQGEDLERAKVEAR